MQMTVTIGNTIQVVNFTYDAGGTPLTMKVGDTTYFYVTNLQGDVMGLTDSTGTMVVGYTYSAYGVITVTLGKGTAVEKLNPLTYRGYVYDAETELFYLQTRYYNPCIGRFINADGLASSGNGLLGNNSYSYCCNNPIMFFDYEGTGLVGLGAQLDITIGGYECGIEVIVYWDDTVCEGGEPVVAVYVYEGASVSMNELINNADYKKVVEKLTLAITINAVDNELGKAGLAALQAALFKDIEVSVSVVGIWGYDNFKSTKDYQDAFKSVSGPFKGFKATYSYSNTCWALCLGATSKRSIIPSWSVSNTNYVEIYNSKEGKK